MTRCAMLRFPFIALLLVMLAQCRPLDSPPPRFTPINASPAIAVLPPEPISNETPYTPHRAQSDRSPILFEGVAFDSRSHRITIIDQPDGPGSDFLDAAAAAQSIHGLAAINGGFFSPDGTPLGLVVSQGKPRGTWNTQSSLTSAVFFESTDGTSGICRHHAFTAKRAASMRELLQSGPMLIDNHQVVSGLNDLKSTSRSVLLWDGHSRWWLGRSSNCSLDQLAHAILQQAPVGWKVRYALNLDGGSSSDLWMSAHIAGKPISSSHWFRKPARNYLVLVPRKTN